MVFGTFDYLHAGHENLFIQARELGNEIVAIIARDKTVRNIKGEIPDHDEKERLENLKNTGWAEFVVLGNPKDKTKVIKEYRPDIIALGYDQFAFTYRLEKFLMEISLDAKIVARESTLLRQMLLRLSLKLFSKREMNEVWFCMLLLYNKPIASKRCFNLLLQFFSRP